jgi:hypothetical protein
MDTTDRKENQEMDTMTEIDETLWMWDLAQAQADFEGRAFPTIEARNSYAALIYLDLMAQQTARRGSR